MQNEYLYNKKELQEELSEYDYGARFYDPVIGRWNVIDPIAVKFSNYSPYCYTADNPIALKDPNGQDITSDGFGNVTFDNNNTPDALNAAYILTGKKKNVYVDIEGNKKTRNRENQLSADGRYNQWAVFAASSLEVAADALESLITPSQLDNLAIETHGGQNGESGIDMLDNQSTSSSNFIYNGEIAKVVGTQPSGDIANCKEIEAKVNQLRGLASLVKKNGNLILAVCDIGKGEAGKDFAKNIALLTGGPMNIYLPKGFVHGAIGVDPIRLFTPFLPGSFWVNTSPGWLKISPKGQLTDVNEVKMNVGNDGPPIKTQ